MSCETSCNEAKTIAAGACCTAIFKAFASEIVPELTQYAMQVGEETSRPIEIYLAVTVLYVISALVINRIMAFIEKRSRVPGFVAAGTGAGGH